MAVCSERGLEPNFTDMKSLQKEKLHKLWNLSIWNKLDQTMVREIDATWNPIYDSILLMYQKLKDIGFKLRDDEIIIEPHNIHDG